MGRRPGKGGGGGVGRGAQSPGSHVLSSSQSEMARVACPGTRTCALRSPERAAASASCWRRCGVPAASTFIVTCVPSCCRVAISARDSRTGMSLANTRVGNRPCERPCERRGCRARWLSGSRALAARACSRPLVRIACRRARSPLRCRACETSCSRASPARSATPTRRRTSTRSC